MEAKFEVCLQSVDGAVAAQAAGAHRVELCAALVEGGITPSPGTMAACAALDIPTMVMIRPRGGDFDYSQRELAVMEDDIRRCVDLGLAGVVFGVLQPDGQVAGPQVKRLLGAAGGLPVTFHRAFDVCRDPLAALKQLGDLGVSRILTSGQAATVPEGLELIAQLVELAGDSVSILPGCGITPSNVVEVLRATGAREYHATAFTTVPSRMTYRNDAVYMGIPGLPEYERQAVCEKTVKQFLEVVQTA